MNAPTLIDTTTLEDLEVFGRTTGGGLFGLIDQTTTLRGRAALRRRLERPSSSVAEIQATQEAVRFFYENPIAWPIDHAGETAVFKYIESNISLGARTRAGEHAERVWLSLRYPDILRELGDGLSDTAGFFSCVRQVCAEIQRMNPPSRVASLVSQLKATSDAVAGSMQHGSLLRRDRELRTGARQSIAEALELVGEVDALRAMGCATRELGLTFPELVEADSFLLEAEGVFHPFVEEPVRNRVLLTGDQPMVFLTGPNMAGKTTYLRSVALVVLLAQAGMGVPAVKARLAPVQAIFTSLNPSDDLRAGLSYFLAEVLRVKEAATLLAEGRRALVIFDEVCKGTNVRDALDASAEVILGFSKARQSAFIFSSHLTELAATLRSNGAVRFQSFQGILRDGEVEYPYELQEGVSEQRLGLTLLHREGIPSLLARIGGAEADSGGLRWGR